MCGNWSNPQYKIKCKETYIILSYILNNIFFKFYSDRYRSERKPHHCNLHSDKSNLKVASSLFLLPMAVGLVLVAFESLVFSHSVAAFHGTIPQLVKCNCFYSHILSWSPFRSIFSLLFISEFSVEEFDVPHIKLQRVSSPSGCTSFVCRPVFILCTWLACRQLPWLEERPYLPVSGWGYPLLQGKTDVRGFGWLPELFRCTCWFAVISLGVQLIVQICYKMDHQNTSG